MKKQMSPVMILTQFQKLVSSSSFIIMMWITDENATEEVNQCSLVIPVWSQGPAKPYKNQSIIRLT